MPLLDALSLDLTDANGSTLLRAGFVAMFFLDGVHASHAVSVADTMRRFVSQFMDGAPLFYPSGDSFKEVRAEDATALLEREVMVPLAPPRFALLDSATDAPRFAAAYCGLDREALAGRHWPHAICGLHFVFDLESMGEHGLRQIFEFASLCARALPLVSGYVSPAFVWREGIDEDVAMRHVERLCRRYRCLDIPSLLVDCFEVGVGVKGAYWCNFLGPQVLDMLGGEAGVRAGLVDYGVHVQSAGEDRLMVVLGPLPTPGDVNRQQDTSLYQVAARLFLPAQQPRSVPYMGFDDESMDAWLHRFTAGDLA